MVRNSELVDDPNLKLSAVHEALNGWAFFASWQGKHFDELAEGVGPANELEKFSRFSEEERKTAELLVKCGFLVFISQTMGEYIETGKLRTIFKECFSQTSETEIVKHLLLFCVQIDLAFFHAAEPQREALRLIEDLTRRYRNNIAALAVLFAKLNALYHRPNIGDENRQAVEGLLTDIYLKIAGVQPKYRGNVGSLRDQFIKFMKSARERAERLEMETLSKPTTHHA